MVRIRYGEGRVTDEIQALRQPQVVRIQIVLGEPVGRIDGPEPDERDSAPLRVRDGDEMGEE